MKQTLLLIGACILFILQSRSSAAQYNVKDFGAFGNGSATDTRSIQKAIDKAFENGGGTVEIPAGNYRTGTLILKDNVNLHLEPGSVLTGSSDVKDYAEVDQKFDSRTKDLYAKYFIIFSEGAHHISITGEGTIYGQGEKYFTTSRPQNVRPFMIRLVNCRNVSIRDVTLLEAANWTLHLLGCTDVNVDGIEITNSGEGNRDGIDIDACQRVTVANSRFRTTDDAIVLKATCDTICQDITITNCVIRSNASGIKTGTESNGGFRNITVSNCVIRDIPVHTGIELITVDGGMLQNVLLDNIAMDNVATPVFIRIGLRCRPYKDGQYVNHIGEVRDIILNNISVTNAKLPSSIMGLNSIPVKNITVENYTVRNSRVQESLAYNEVPFEEFSYPMARVFKDVPASGLYCRNAEGLHLENVNIFPAPDENRAALAFDRINGLELISVKAAGTDPSVPLAHLRNSNHIYTHFCRAAGQGQSLFELEEGTCENIHIDGNFIDEGQKEVSKVVAMTDESLFEDFKTEIKYSVENASEYKGLQAFDLVRGPLEFPLSMTKRGSLQLCLLILNDSSVPEKVKITYEGITQEFTINWNEWGWAPLTLLKQYDTDRKVGFKIEPANPDSHLKVSKVYLRYQDIGFTD